jgi:DNA processing protein
MRVLQEILANFASPGPQQFEMSPEEELYWLALHLIPGLGRRKAAQLLSRYGNPRTIFEQPAAELERDGLAGSVARSIASGCTFDDAATQQQKAMAVEAVIVPMSDDRYPPRLREIFDPPILLFVRGRVELLRQIAVGVVGTRRPTAYGLSACQRLSTDLARAGLAIASGMARGIDTVAHRAALDAGGDTVAVFGCGVDGVYPAENRKLAAEIAQKGLLVSEFPMGAPAYPQNFPVRNRIIAGMSAGVLIVEGAQHSGSAITARMAMEQQREVFAVPGNITSKMSWGPNLLIKQGAKLVQEWTDVVEELPAATRRELIDRAQRRLFPEGAPGPSSEPGPASQTAEITPVARELLKHIPMDRPIQLDELHETLEGYSSSELIAGLFELEMSGLARQLPGKNFVKVW